jgi:Protein of unknown function (DUF3710)
VIFSRDRGSGRRAKGDEPRRGARHAARRRERDEFGYPDEDDDAAVVGAEADGTTGPYDIADAPAGDRLDLGSMEVPAVEGVEVRVQADPDGAIHQVVLVYGDSALQLGVFAAPRSEGIWDEVRADIRKELRNDGAASEEVDGEYGMELRSRVPMGEGSTDIRFVGIDGPRWMVRAVYQGPAAVDPDAAGPLAECLRGLVVNRGTEAMPVREPLPLRLPREMAEQAEQAQQAQQAQQREGANGAPVGQGGGNVRRRPSPRPRRRG